MKADETLQWAGKGVLMDIVVPDLGEVGKVQLVRWLAAPGDEVEAGDAVAEVEAEKAVFVVEAPVAGVLDRIIVAAGGVARPGQAIASLRVG